MHSSTASLLLDCLSYTDQTEKAERLGHVSADEWQRVAELAQLHDVESLLYHILTSLKITPPPEVAARLMQKSRNNLMWNVRLYRELHKLLRLLKEKDISVIVLKGAYLAEAIYENIGLRSMGDVDLLVKKEDLQRVEQEMLALGCEPEESNRVVAEDNWHFTYKMPGSGLRVEMHWIIIATSYPFQIDVDGLWNRSRQVTLMRAPALTFSPEDLLLYLCLHTAKHAYDMKIKMLCDIGEIVRRQGMELNWQEISMRAKQWGTRRPVYIILRLAQELLNVTFPVDWLASLRPDGFDERYLEPAREYFLTESDQKKDALQLPPNLAQVWGSKKLSEKLALIIERLFISREMLATQYPVPADSWRIYLYYPVRLKDILAQRGAALWRLARGDSKTRTSVESSNRVSELYNWMMQE